MGKGEWGIGVLGKEWGSWIRKRRSVGSERPVNWPSGRREWAVDDFGVWAR